MEIRSLIRETALATMILAGGWPHALAICSLAYRLVQMCQSSHGSPSKRKRVQKEVGHGDHCLVG